MKCPLCGKKPENSQLYGFYRGNLFVVKEFFCCGAMNPISMHKGSLEFIYDQKKNKYIPVIRPHVGRHVKFDFTRILVSTNEMGRHS